jgi:hypothetical protein
MKYITLLFACCISISLQAQFLQGKVIDDRTEQPLGYATVQSGAQQGVITNQEGDFTLRLKDGTVETTLIISHIGYEEMRLPVKDFQSEQVIRLKPSATLLNEVVVGPTLTVSQIIQKYVDNASKNHSFSNMRVQYFRRTRENYLPKEFEIDLKKISFANKKQLQEKIRAFEDKFRNKEITSYTEVLTDVFNEPKGMGINHLKALKLEGVEGFNMDNFQDKFFENTFQKLESPYTYRIKSGIIPLEKEASFKEIGKESQAADTLKNTNDFYVLGNVFIANKEFINNRDLYDYSMNGVKSVNGMPCYHISFSPYKKKGKYVGELYINTDDFGMVYYSYELAPNKKEFNLNLKWVLGIKINAFENSKEVLMNKTADGKYYTQLIRTVEGNYAYIDRSLTITENHPKRSERKKMKLNFLVEMITRTDDEIVAVEVNSHDPNTKVERPKYILFEKKRQYDPNYWQGYNILQATEAVREFRD